MNSQILMDSEVSATEDLEANSMKCLRPSLLAAHLLTID